MSLSRRLPLTQLRVGRAEGPQEVDERPKMKLVAEAQRCLPRDLQRLVGGVRVAQSRADGGQADRRLAELDATRVLKERDGSLEMASYFALTSASHVRRRRARAARPDRILAPGEGGPKMGAGDHHGIGDLVGACRSPS